MASDTNWRDKNRASAPSEASQSYRESHRNADTDQGDDSIHHTLGDGPFQSARGSKLADLEEGFTAFRNGFDNARLPITLENGWVPFGGIYSAPTFKIINNSIQLNGMIADGIGNIGTLPEGTWPDTNWPFFIVSAGGTGHAEVYIGPAGEMEIIYIDGGSNVYVNLDSIRYERAQ